MTASNIGERAVAYARFSSDNQREESITAQLRAIREYAQRQGVSIVAEYIDEARSATTDDRPEFLRMIDEIATGRHEVSYVYVHKLDR
ncbi:MAG: recombinase family protein, partial [Methanocella sp.]